MGILTKTSEQARFMERNNMEANFNMLKAIVYDSDRLTAMYRDRMIKFIEAVEKEVSWNYNAGMKENKEYLCTVEWGEDDKTVEICRYTNGSWDCEPEGIVLAWKEKPVLA